MTAYSYKREYLKSFDLLGREDQRLVIACDEEIRLFCEVGKSAYGLRIKKLYETKQGVVFEARASRSIRILWTKHAGRVSFVLVGGHDEVKNYLKNL